MPENPSQVSIRCREMGTAELGHRPGVGLGHRVSIRWREMGTAELVLASATPRPPSFYSLSRDGDSGTRGAHDDGHRSGGVSIRCREMGTAEHPNDDRDRDQARVSIRCREMGTAELDHEPRRPGAVRPVSIRCREMGTAELPL